LFIAYVRVVCLMLLFLNNLQLFLVQLTSAYNKTKLCCYWCTQNFLSYANLTILRNNFKFWISN